MHSDHSGYRTEVLHWLSDDSFLLETADGRITFQRQPRGVPAESKPGTAANGADAPKEAAINLSRVTYRLPNAKAKALDSILREHVKGVTLETKVEGDSLTVTTAPEAQKRIGQFIPLVRGDPLKSEAVQEPPTPVPPQPGAAPVNPPPDDVRGRVTAVNERDGLVTINLGSDAGLSKGHTLFLYRLKPRPTYLGTLRIDDVKPNEAVGKPFISGAFGARIQKDDEVASKIP
jgi:hypothetical protein